MPVNVIQYMIYYYVYIEINQWSMKEEYIISIMKEVYEEYNNCEERKTVLMILCINEAYEECVWPERILRNGN